MTHDDLPEDYELWVLVAFGRRVQEIRATICEHIGDSSKLKRAAEELETIEGYFRDIRALFGARSSARSSVFAGYRLFGCVGLITLAASDVAVRAQNHKAVATAARSLQRLRDDVEQLSRELFANELGLPLAQYEAQRARDLVKILEEFETHKSTKDGQ